MSQYDVCDFCYQNILQEQNSWAYHHPSYVSLRNSAQRSCIFCIVLFTDVSAQLENLRELYLAQPEGFRSLEAWLRHDARYADQLAIGQGSKSTSLYRWSIRKLGRTRESKVMIAVTFRGVLQTAEIHESSQEPPVTPHFTLPDRVFYCFPQGDLGVLLQPAQIGLSTDPRVNGGTQIKNWIQKCGIEHKSCPKRAGAGSKFMPTRLLYIGGRREHQPVRIVSTKEANIKAPYTTLSHCWGPDDPARKDLLTAGTLKDFTSEGVPWKHLSNNFRQAIEVARLLQVDYIWIDSLCIIQNDKSDWKHEAVLMDKVYRNSYCNIAASDAVDTKGGLFRSRVPQDVLPARLFCHVPTPMFSEGTWRIVREDLWDRELLQGPLYRRGWVFQERMLAPRILHFSKHQIFWDCAEMSACESLPERLPFPLDCLASTDRHWRGRLQETSAENPFSLSAVNDDSIDDFWSTVVGNYTSLDLTKQADKRIAVWSIAKLVRDILAEQYAFGLWELALEQQLCWRVVDCTTAERPRELATNPSWSWTSVKGRVLVPYRREKSNGDYSVTDHDDKPVKFITREDDYRPKIPRLRSEDSAEELEKMGEELRITDERRRKSRATSRQNSDVTYFASGHDKSTGRATPLGRLTTSPQPMYDDKNEPDTDVIFNQRLPRKEKHQRSNLKSTKSSQGNDLTTAMVPDRQYSETSLGSKKEFEPDLKDKALGIKCFVHHGVLQCDNQDNSWTLICKRGNWSSEEVTIDAYPDLMPNNEDKQVQFIVLALMKQNDTNELFREEETSVGSLYTGQGIIVRSLDQERDSCPCYVRIGAFTIHRLSEQAWNELKLTRQGGSRGVGTALSIKIFLL